MNATTFMAIAFGVLTPEPLSRGRDAQKTVAAPCALQVAQQTGQAAYVAYEPHQVSVSHDSF